jgi:hypothetical protein
MSLIRKFDWRNLILLGVSLIVTLAIAEVGLRLFWNPVVQSKISGYNSAPYLCPNKYWKVWHYPNANVNHIIDCFNVKYSTNSLGMRSKEIEAGKRGIMLLGDSFIEGYGVNDNETAAVVMNTLVGEKYFVLNMSTSGGFSTVHETALYENFGRFYSPAVVVLYFLNYNDLYDNVKAIGEGLVDENLELIYPRAAGLDEVLKYINSNKPKTKAKRGEKGLRLTSFFDRGWRVFKEWFQLTFNVRLNIRTAVAEVYSPNPSPIIEKGWKITTRTLRHLKELTDKNNAKLVVVSIADPYQTDKTWLRLSSLNLKKHLDGRYPNRKMAEICRELGITHYDMLDDTLKYINNKNLKFPYLSFTCNTHYNREGHALLANLTVSFLKKQGIISVK